MNYFPYADENQKKFIAMTARNAANRLSDRFRFKIYDAGPENFYLSFREGLRATCCTGSYGSAACLMTVIRSVLSPS